MENIFLQENLWLSFSTQYVKNILEKNLWKFHSQMYIPTLDRSYLNILHFD